MSKDLLTVKKLLAAIIILAMLITATVDMLAYANNINSLTVTIHGNGRPSIGATA